MGTGGQLQEADGVFVTVGRKGMKMGTHWSLSPALAPHIIPVFE